MQVVPSISSPTRAKAKTTNRSRAPAKSKSKDTLHVKAKPEIANASPDASGLTDKIAIAAYFLAERRGFAPGYELEDWLSAERQILETKSLASC